MNYTRKKFKPLTLWIIVAVTLIIGVLLILWQSNAKDSYFPLVAIVIDFVVLSIAIQAATFASFKFKPKKIKHPTCSYSLEDFNNLEKNLLDNNYTRKGLSFGALYNKVVGKILYKVLLVNDFTKYFNNDHKEDVSSSNKNIDKCVGLIGLEIFLNPDQDTINKVADFTFQNEKVFYEGMVYLEETKELLRVNAQEPNTTFAEHFSRILADLNIDRKDN